MRLPPAKAPSRPRRLAPLRAEAPHLRVGQASGEDARRIGRCREARRVRLPRLTTHKARQAGHRDPGTGAPRPGRGIGCGPRPRGRASGSAAAGPGAAAGQAGVARTAPAGPNGRGESSKSSGRVLTVLATRLCSSVGARAGAHPGGPPGAARGRQPTPRHDTPDTPAGPLRARRRASGAVNGAGRGRPVRPPPQEQPAGRAGGWWGDPPQHGGELVPRRS